MRRRMGGFAIPKLIRDRLRLRRGDEFVVTERHRVDELLLEVELVETPHGTIAFPAHQVPELTVDAVRDTLEKTRVCGRPIET